MDSDAIIERARDVQEMERSPGWKAVRDEIEKEISETESTIGLIEIGGRSPAEVGADYIAIVQRVSGLKRTLEIVESIKEDGAREQQHEHGTQG